MKKARAFIVPWRKTWYAPVEMAWGTLQSFYISITAKRAWDRFCKATGKSKEQLRKEGYCVKRLTITIDSQKGAQRNEDT